MRETLAMGDAERTAFLEAHETRPLQPAPHDQR
jgi:hypothetical protein